MGVHYLLYNISNCVLLEFLYLGAKLVYTNTILDTLANYCNRLHTLQLAEVTDYGILTILDNCKLLSDLLIYKTTNFSCPGISLSTRVCPQLSSLLLNYTDHITINQLYTILSNCLKLTILTLRCLLLHEDVMSIMSIKEYCLSEQVNIRFDL